MGAQFRIDQDGLAEGTPDFARTDGLDDGSEVTLVHTGGVFTSASFRILSTPSADTTARTTLTRGSYQPGAGICVYTFTPTAGVYGSYLIEETVDGRTVERVFAIRTPNRGLLIPAWNATSDPNAYMGGGDGPAQVKRGSQNEPTAKYPAGDPRGDFPAFELMFLELDAIVAAPSPVLFQWNGVDMTQFGPALKPSCLFFEYIFAGTPECTVVSRPEGNRLRIYVPGTGPTSRGMVYLPIAASLALELPERYIIEFSLIDGIADGNLYGGVAYCCNGEVATREDVRAVVALNTCSGGFGYQGVISETTWYAGVGAQYQFNATGHTPNGAPIPAFVRIEVKTTKPAADQPGGLINIATHGDNGDGGACYRFDEATHFVQPWPAGWDDLTAADLNQAALVMFANAAIDNPYVEFGHFRILRHPLDSE